MTDKKTPDRMRNVKLNNRILAAMAVIFVLAACVMVITVNQTMKHYAIVEAKAKAKIILDRNLATHTYFSHQLKPALFKITEKRMPAGYFDPVWMSSTFAVREIDRYFHSFNPIDYYYKECAINARSPQNEADPFESAYLEKLKTVSDPEHSSVRIIDGNPFLVVLRPGEIMEETCLRCHSTPDRAPADLVNTYGHLRSFDRRDGEMVSAFSLRIPLKAAYGAANRFSLQLSLFLGAVLVALFLAIVGMNRRWIFKPLKEIREKAVKISTDPQQLGVKIPLPYGKELYDVTRAFNGMSERLRQERDHLEMRIAARTRDLSKTNAELRAEIDERARAEEDLFRQKELLQTIMDNIPLMVAFLDGEGQFKWVNRTWEKTLGWRLEEAQSKDMLAEFYPDPEDRSRVLAFIRAAEGRWEEFGIRTREGAVLDTAWTNVRLSDGTHIGMGEDITQRKKEEAKHQILEAQLRQAQKMEAIGRLAGGVAHDFNNMLSIIMGYAELAKDHAGMSGPVQKDLDEILDAGKRSMNLVRQLLAFARKQTIQPMVLNLNELIEESQKILGRLVGEDLEICFIPGMDLWNVKMDPGQIDQILANLLVNARDAITGVGTITIETVNVVFDQTYCDTHAGFKPGEYVLLSFSDSGKGMNGEMLKNIFEPFFTTKGRGEGTGLGLATVYGIMKQNDGFINVYSEPGEGTTFKLYFPRYHGQSERATEEEPSPVLGGKETILVVEDEQTILNLARSILEKYGYEVLTADSPKKILSLCEQHEGDIHLLITDVVMPEMDGRQLKKQVEKMRPGIKVLYMSGYTANVIAHKGVLDDGVRFIQKPFSQKDFLRKVRQILDSSETI